IYDLNADLSKPMPLVYSRIGNDIEQIAFFGWSAERISRALLPLLDSSDPEMRRLAERASPIVRETNFAAVNSIASAPGPDTQPVLKPLAARPYTADVLAVMHPPSASPESARQGVSSSVNSKQKQLDEVFFRGYVEPILRKKGKDGYACANCHGTHTLFNATWSTVMNVVDTRNPENSLLLLKPTSSAETEGVVASNQLSHGGGVRWQ